MNFTRRLRSFVRRNGRRTVAQDCARELLAPRFGLDIAAGKIGLEQVFDRQSASFLEVGFGSGQSLLALAKAFPEKNFIGVETHQPGIGSLYLGIQQAGLTNIRVYDADVVDVLEQCLPDESLSGMQIFFPDPWPKRKHHPRRLIQPGFLEQVQVKLKPEGELHLATDWEDYARHMMRVLSQAKGFINLAGESSYAERSPHRPIKTKFECRAERAGRLVWEMRFRRLYNTEWLP